MATSSVRLEILPMANKPRYEKGLIGQLFTGDSKDTSTKAKSPMVVRAKTDFQPEPEPDTKQSAKLETRQPDVRAKTPEPAAANSPPPELQSGHGYLERVSPAPPARAASTSPPPRTRSQSPLAGKSPVLPGLSNLTGRRGGKRIKIDLKKGNYNSKAFFFQSVVSDRGLLYLSLTHTTCEITINFSTTFMFISCFRLINPATTGHCDDR